MLVARCVRVHQCSSLLTMYTCACAVWRRGQREQLQHAQHAHGRRVSYRRADACADASADAGADGECCMHCVHVTALCALPAFAHARAESAPDTKPDTTVSECDVCAR
jgi:hypothetical protein